MSGDCGGILKHSHPSSLKTALACALFWLGSPSCKNIFVSLPERINVAGKFSVTKSTNIGPSRCWYDLASITPLPKVIATKTFIPDGHHLRSWNLLQYSHDQVVHTAFSKCALEGLKLDRKDVSCEWMIRHRNRNQFYPFFAWVTSSCRAYKFQTFAVIVSCHQTFLSRL